jgi:leucyl/phenylalanyl-tRNA--protein transferase
VPEEPPPTTVAFPDASGADEHGIVLRGGDLEPGTVLAAYRRGLFPMRLRAGDLAWFSPDPRGILEPEALRVTRSLRRSVRRFEVTVDEAFADVIVGCADRGPDDAAWITPEVRSCYLELHRLGWARSVEAWTEVDGERRLAGGLYGLAIGGLFAGESMFHRERDASKAALVALVERLREGGVAGRLVDVQWLTPHLASLGAVEVARAEYERRLARALELPGW